MADGAGLRLTTARYFTPNGTSIQATGITPDILVPTVLPDSNDNAKDNDSAHKQPKFLREKDLKHHIENGNGEENGEKTGEENKKDAKKEAATQNKIDEKLQKDRQLNTALMLLKGVNVFGNLERQ